MKLGIIIYASDAEIVWNAFRIGVFSFKANDSVSVFLLAKGIECESLDSENFKVTEQMQTFVDSGGKILACGTCLKSRQSEGLEICPLSTMQDCYDVIMDSQKIITF